MIGVRRMKSRNCGCLRTTARSTPRMTGATDAISGKLTPCWAGAGPGKRTVTAGGELSMRGGRLKTRPPSPSGTSTAGSSSLECQTSTEPPTWSRAPSRRAESVTNSPSRVKPWADPSSWTVRMVGVTSRTAWRRETSGSRTRLTDASSDRPIRWRPGGRDHVDPAWGPLTARELSADEELDEAIRSGGRRDSVDPSRISVPMPASASSRRSPSHQGSWIWRSDSSSIRSATLEKGVDGSPSSHTSR